MSHPARPLLGWLCLVPAAAIGVWQLVLPAVQTVGGSFYRSRFGRRGGEYVGPAAYTESDLLSVLLPSALVGVLAVVPAGLIAGAVGIGIGTAAARAPERPRRQVRFVLGFLLVLYAPVGIAVGVLRDGGPAAWLGPEIGTVYGLVAALLPMLAALAAVVTMALVGDRGRLPASGGVVAGLVGAGALVAGGLQVFSVPLATGLRTPGVLIYEAAFERQEYGTAFALSALLLIPLTVLGVMVTVVLLVVGLRVELAPVSRRDPGNGSVGSPLPLLLTLGVVVVFGLLAAGWVTGLFATREVADELAVHVVTWLPAIVVALLQLVVAALAAYGIGVLGPLGDRSPWLLLGFAPGLFVGLTPLFAAYVARSPAPPGDLDFFPPMLLNVPLLFVLTYVFAGLREPGSAAWSADDRGPIRRMARAAGWIGAVVSCLVLAQTLAWNLLLARRPGDVSGPTLLLQLGGATGDEGPLPQQLATPLPMLLVLGLIAAFALRALDRLRLRVGPSAP